MSDAEAEVEVEAGGGERPGAAHPGTDADDGSPGERGAVDARVTIRVVAAVLEREGRWLVGLRPEEKRHGGLWEFPGGKLDPGETMHEAVERELLEELELRTVDIGRTLHVVRDAGSPFVIEFVEVVADGTPVAHEHTRIGWFDVAGLEALTLAPADRSFVGWLRSRAGAGADRPDGTA